MKTKRILATVIITVAFFIGCSRVPISKRAQLNMMPESSMISMALTNYKDFLHEHPVLADNSDPNVHLVKTVGARISGAVERYLSQTKNAKRTKDYKWEFNLVNESTINAWCMPGGKVVVYTGLLPVTNDETGLAVVMGHEVAHAIARHGNERMSQMLMAQVGGIALDIAMINKSQETRALYNIAYGAGTTVGLLLPYSRLQETEADKLGLVFMAMAGYDPNQAVGFWERMQKSGNGSGKGPDIFSTHPSDASRIKALKEYMPQALKFYRPL